MLAILLCRANRIVPFDQLVGALWSDQPPESAKAQVYICVSALRRALGDEHCITTTPSGYLIQVDAEELDALRFEALFRAARHGDEARPSQVVALLDTALGLWRGPAYDGLTGPLVEDTATWLNERRTAAVEQRQEMLLRLGREDPQEIAELCRAHPLRERFPAFLMTSLYRSGRQVEALEVFRSVRQAFVDDLGIEPGAELQALHQAILNQDPTLTLAPAAGHPGAQIAVAPRQLPPPLADFTGREAILEAFDSHLAPAALRAGSPVVLVSGMPGIGKTSTSVQAAHRLADRFPDGQLVARLGASSGQPVEPAAVLAQFLRALRHQPGDLPDDLHQRTDLLRSTLAGRRVLLLLDDAASEQQVAPLLPAQPGCAVLVTSRRRLGGLPGGRHIDLEALPDPAAASLLLGIVGDDRPADGAAVGAVVQACAGVPLALRLAGSRLAATPYRSLGELANLLSDPASALDQFTYGDVDLRVLLEQAYRALSAGTGRTFRLIGLLPRVPLPAWLVASSAATPVGQLAAQLDELVTGRLLEVAVRSDGTVRYQLHPLVHLVAQRLGRLEEPVDGRAGVDRALAAYLDELADLNQRLGGGEYLGPVPPPAPTSAAPAVDPRVWFARERVSLLALIDLAATTGRHEYAWQLAVAAAVLFRATGRLDDWRATHQAALAAAQRASDRRGEAAVLCSLGSLGLVRGDRASSGGLLRAAALWHELDDPIGRAHAVRNLAQLDQTNGSYPSAAARYREAAQTFARHGDQVAQGYSLAGLVQTHLECGNLAEAYPLVRELLALSRDCRDRRLAAIGWLRLAETEAADGRLGQALQHLGRALTIAGTQGDRAGQARILVSMAEVQAERHDLGAAEAILDRLAELGSSADDSALRGRTALVRARVQQARGQVTGAENLIVTAAELFRVHGTAAWQDRALRLLSELRGGLPTVA